MHDPLVFKQLSEIINSSGNDDTSPCDIIVELNHRIERIDPEVQSYVRLNTHSEEECLQRKTEQRLMFPVSIKDLIDTEGIETNYGSPIFKGNIPRRDAKLVSNLKSNGGIIVGKTVTHEFALGIESRPTKNPWDLNRIPGGSSGGSAAAVSAGLSIFAIGTDTGGSIRIPAAMCGVTGFKPTYDLVSRRGIFPESWSLDHVGPITRYAKDLKMELKFMTGKKLNQPLKLNRKLKVGVAWDLFDQCAVGVKNSSLAALEKIHGVLDIDFIEVNKEDLMFEDMGHYQEIIDTSEIACVHKDIYKNHPDKYMKSSIEQIEEGHKVHALEYLEAQRNRKKLKFKFNHNFKNLDLILTPALPDIAPQKNDIEVGSTKSSKRFTVFLAPLNYSGNPSLVIPIGLSMGLPVGIQIIANSYFDHLCIDFASDIQEQTNWHKLIPDRYK